MTARFEYDAHGDLVACIDAEDNTTPLGYMPVMIIATVPTITLVLFAVGFGSFCPRLYGIVRDFFRRGEPRLSDKEAALGYPQLLFFIAIGAALGPWLLPKTPIFGGTKHWITAYPFMALFAGRGLELAYRALGRLLEGGPSWRKPLAKRRKIMTSVPIFI